MIRKHCFFSGKVQGVFFRANTRDKAQEKGVKGWVKNLRDGRVEAIFEGPENRVDEVIEFCKNNQPHARVDDFEIKEEEPTGEFDSFRIKR
ncbi:MAG: acylphosphatase [Candidatus Thermoplasmatota archaeon]|nr:acylphosphatase [Candidatus Thermoplasmatota archaeon]MBS3789582.1 acylphosphatase [Candidatus Thermoplasmatota archaeon]